MVASWGASVVEARPIVSAALLSEHQDVVNPLRLGLAQAGTDRAL